MKTIKNGGYVSWGETNYIIPTKTGLKEYYVSKTNYNGPFRTKNVLSARGSGNARFNVMALSDYNNGATYKFEDAKSITSGDWSTPTISAWGIFAGQLGITFSNYSRYGLKAEYWSSSIPDDYWGYGDAIVLSHNMTSAVGASGRLPVRLVRTF